MPPSMPPPAPPQSGPGGAVTAASARAARQKAAKKAADMASGGLLVTYVESVQECIMCKRVSARRLWQGYAAATR